MNAADLIKSATVAIVAVAIVVGGMVQIYFLLQAGIISGDAGLAILGPLIGAATAFVFQRDATASGGRATLRAIDKGAETANTTPTITT